MKNLNVWPLFIAFILNVTLAFILVLAVLPILSYVLAIQSKDQDILRKVVTKKISERQKILYERVHDARKAADQKLKVVEYDDAARRIIIHNVALIHKAEEERLLQKVLKYKNAGFAKIQIETQELEDSRDNISFNKFYIITNTEILLDILKNFEEIPEEQKQRFLRSKRIVLLFGQ